jgi:hypothetical protein
MLVKAEDYEASRLDLRERQSMAFYGLRGLVLEAFRQREGRA